MGCCFACSMLGHGSCTCPVERGGTISTKPTQEAAVNTPSEDSGLMHEPCPTCGTLIDIPIIADVTGNGYVSVEPDLDAAKAHMAQHEV